MKKWIALCLTLALCLCMMAGCGGNDETDNGGGGESEPQEQQNPAGDETTGNESEDDYVVQITASAALCGAPQFIAMEKGFLDECGVKYNYFNSESNQWDLMAAGKCDSSYGLMPTFIQRIANGFEIDVTMGCHFGCINVVASDASGIEDIPGLAGHNVGIPTGLGSDPAILLQRMLVEYDVPIQDVNLMTYNNTELATALQEGYIDAFVSWDPYATVVSQYEGNHLIFNQADDPATADEYCCVLGLRPEFVDEHPDVARRFCQAISMACDWIAENPEEAAKISYEKGYIPDEDYEFNGTLLDSYRYGANFNDAKASFIRVTQDLADLDIVQLDSSAEELADSVFINVGELPE